MWNSPGFSKLTSNYTDLLFDPAANAEWCEFIAEKIRGIVDDPETAERADPEGPPLRREAAAVRHRLLRGVQPPERRRSSISRETPIVRVTETRDRDDRRRARVRHHRVGDRLRLRHRRARRAWASAAATGSRSTDHWADGPTTFLGVQTAGFPNLFFPGGPHAAAGNNPRYNGDQVDFVTDTLVYARDHGYDDDRGRPRGRGAVDRDGRPGRRASPRSATSSYFFGTNIPGKPRRVPAELRRPPEALQGDRPTSWRTTTRRSSCRSVGRA